MRIERIVLRHVRLPLVHPFETSFGRTDERQVLLLAVSSEGVTGWGECVAGEGPFYSYEDIHTAEAVLRQWIVPATLGESFSHPGEFPSRVARIRGHPMAKAALESALWDLYAKRLATPLWKLLGGVQQRIPCGVSIGIQDSPTRLLEKIEEELVCGYRRIKIKIKPGWDLEVVGQVRRAFPQMALMVDANSAYTLEDFPRLKELDAYELMMIEQPLAHDDLLDHARLQEGLQTPVCLDESILHTRAARQAIQIGACRIINIKMGRVGGLSEALRIHQLCAQRGIPVWCGGMLETGIGRAHNVALSTLQNFRLPGDVSASRRYFERDTIDPPVEVNSQGFIEVPDAPGIGFQPDLPWIEKITIRREEWRASSPNFS